MFVLARTHPVPLNFYTFEIYRTEINEYYVSFKELQWNLYKVETIGAWQKFPYYGDVHPIEITSKKTQKSSKVNMKSTICHEFPIPDLLEGPKDPKTKENAKFFSF